MSHYLRGYVLVDAKEVQVHVLYSSLSNKGMHAFKHNMVNIRYNALDIFKFDSNPT